jgi:hypothetical protein
MKLKKAFLTTLIVSLVVAALIGIYTLLLGQDFSREWRILATVLSISFFSMTALITATTLERAGYARLVKYTSMAGIAVSWVAFVIFIAGIWTDVLNDFDPYYKILFISTILAFTLAHFSILALARLPLRWDWVRWATLASITTLALYIITMIILELEGDFTIRLLGVLGILDGCGTIITPVLLKLVGTHAAALQHKAIDYNITLQCPRCNKRGTYPLGAITCDHCSLPLRVMVLEESDIDNEDSPS